MSETLKKYFGNGEKLGIKIKYTEEKNPLGTAGAIKLAEEYLKDDNFFMLNGDVIINFNFKEMIRAHEKYNGIGVIAAKVVPDPSRYGVLIVEKKTDKILQFLEKSAYIPPEGKKIPMPINAGIYLLKPKIFEFIKPNKKVSIEKEVFPRLIKEESLYYYLIPGIWKDIGKPEELLEGNIQLMNDLLKNSKEEKKNLISNTLDIEGKVSINPPVVIGENVVIRKGCEIGPNVIIGDNVYIDANTEIKESLLYNEVYINKNVKIEKTIISDSSIIHENVELKGNGQNLVIIGSYVEVLDNIRLIAPSDSSLTVCHHDVVRLSII
jgi:mannose-1-phosphate guanylyltransferase